MSDKKFKLSSHYGTVHKTGDIYSIRFERLFNHAVKKVWDAITVPEQLALWLSPNIKDPATKIELILGGKVSMQFMMGVSEGSITALENQKLLEITWSKDNVSKWELFVESNNKCRLVFTEILPPSILPHATAAYHGYLDFLSLVLDGKVLAGNILETWQEISKEATKKYSEMFEKLLLIQKS